MTKFNLSSLLSSAALSLILVGTAGATTITVGGTSVSGNGLETSVVGATTNTFNGISALPSNFSITGSAALVTGSHGNQYAAPTGDTSQYVTTGIGSVLDSPLAAGTNYIGFYWGSMDNFNTVTLKYSNGSSVSYSGDQVASITGVSDNGNSSYFVNFAATPGLSFSSIDFSSTSNAFEFDNLATATATPEPASIAMLAGGLLIVAGAARRRKA